MFFSYTYTPEIYTLSLHDALPICVVVFLEVIGVGHEQRAGVVEAARAPHFVGERVHQIAPVIQAGEIVGDGEPLERSEEHTSELQSLTNLVCRLLLEKKKNTQQTF